MHTPIGFTLIEMLIALSIAAILLTLSFGLGNYFLQRTEEELVRRQLMRAIQLSYHYAQVRRMPIVLMESKEYQGQIIFVDKEKDGILHDQTALIAVFAAPRVSGTLHFRSYPHYRNFLRFMPYDLSSNDNGTFWFCRTGSKMASFAIMISKSARPRSVFPDKNGVIQDSKGKPLPCLA